MLKQKKLLLVVFFFLVIPSGVLAAGLVPCGGPTEEVCTVTDFFVLVARVVNFLIAIAGIYAMFKIVQAGFWLAVSQGNEETIKNNQTQISNAVVGFVLVMMAYLFVNTSVNLILMSKCNIDLKNPLNYLIIDTEACLQNKSNPAVPAK